MENNYGILERYGDNLTEKKYITNPAIGRDEEIKKMSLVLLTPDKSPILTGKPGVGKTAIVEGLAYLIQRNEVPNALKNYQIIKIDTQAIMGTVKETGDTRIKNLMGTLKKIEHKTGAKMAYTPFIQEKIMKFIVEANKEYNRVYETAGRYPDVALNMLAQAFSEAVFDNKEIVTIEHIEKAIKNSKAIYPDVINK